jgi:ribosomal protein S18 acetylase RimI-like enzyme
MPDFIIRTLSELDHGWVAHTMVEAWGSEIIVAHERIYRPAHLPGFAAVAHSDPVGLLTYCVDGDACEVVTLNVWREGKGIGTALLEAVRQTARQKQYRRLWLVTTNDNTHALRFYQKKGFHIAAIHVNVVELNRRLKPEIPLTGMDGIPIRDEIELELQL